MTALATITDIAPFGYCPLPECGRPCVEQKPNGTVICEKGHAHRPDDQPTERRDGAL